MSEPIRENRWAHPKSHEIFEFTQMIRGREDVLVNGWVTLVHHRPWTVLVSAAAVLGPIPSPVPI